MEEKKIFANLIAGQIGLLSDKEAQLLRSSTVALPGLGGVGGMHFLALVRSGIGRFKIADPDFFELHNLGRQNLTLKDVGRPKLKVLQEQATRINPYLEISSFPQGVTPDNVTTFLKDVDVVVDGIEFFALETRRLVFNEARKRGIPVITAAPLGFNASLLVFHPQKSPSFEQYFGLAQGHSRFEKLLLFTLGLAPRAWFLKYLDLDAVDLQAGRGPASILTCHLCTALACTEALRILLKRPGLKPVPHYLQIDIYLRKFHKGYLRKGNYALKQRLKFWLLKRKLRPYFPSEDSGPR